MTALLNSFRIEAREIISSLTTELLTLEKSPENRKALAACLRLAHNLKGTARIVKQFAIGDMAHTLEDALLPLRENDETAESDYFSDLLRIVGRMREAIDDLVTPAADPTTMNQGSPHKSPRLAEGESLSTVRVEIAEMDQLLEGLSEATIQLGALRSAENTLRQAMQSVASLHEALQSSQLEARGLTGNRIRALVDNVSAAVHQTEQMLAPSLSRIEQELESVRDRANTLRLLPVSSILDTLELAMRDTAHFVGKSVQFIVSGADIKLEGHILLSVRDALLHAIRNAVDHGLESPEERVLANKPAVGTISLDVVHQGRRVEFRCHDDGRGVDPEKVRAKLVESGLIGPEIIETLTADELISYLFETGLSTAEKVTEISGRGVGLDVVRVVANRLRGHASIQSKWGHGTTITIDVPMSLSAMTVLAVETSGHTVHIPFDTIRQTLRLPSNEILHNSEGVAVLYEERAIPLLEIGSVLGLSQKSAARPNSTIIVVQAGSKVLALGADAILDTLDIVVKPLPPGFDASPAIAGAAFDNKGDPVLVLDPARLDAPRTENAPARIGSVVAAPRQLPILIIDDSLTTRMLEQSILEGAGYVVDLCASAEDALRRAHERKYGLFIVDVEMPGMNGFEFTRVTRANPQLAAIPIIMVTSLGSAESRQQGLDAGASEYIVKRDFDQKYFVDKVVALLGAP